jgi:uncharacterized protein YbaP (TraB family)
MRRSLGVVIALALALGGACVSRQRAAPATASAVAAAAPERRPLGWGDDPADRAPGPLLFEVDAPGGRIDLFGTMHTEPLASMPKVAADRYAAARTVAFEVDVDSVNVGKVLAVAMLPAGQSLDQMLGPEAWERLTKYLGPTMAPAALARFRPWLAFALILQKATGAQQTAQTMEVGMLKQGRASNKSVRFLETVEQQLAILDQTIDAAMLIKMIAVLDQLPTAFQALTDAYRGGDVSTVETVIGGMDKRTGMTSDQVRTLLGARNERWIPFLERLAAEGGAFVAVGAGHLVGRDGLVALLRARGYRVVRVR